jgi:Bacterial self-protective colicin-like immunity
MSAPDSASAYDERYLADPASWATAAFDILDSLFADVDGFSPDESTRAPIGGIDEAELRASAETALVRLRELQVRQLDVGKLAKSLLLVRAPLPTRPPSWAR